MLFNVSYAMASHRILHWLLHVFYAHQISHHCRQVSILYSCTIYWSHNKRFTYICVAGRHGRWESVAEEMDDLPEGSAPVLPAWWWFSLQHHPGHVRADSEPRGLEEHCVLWRLHISVVRACFRNNLKNKKVSMTFMTVFFSGGI